MSERQSAAIKAWWDARKAAGWRAAKMAPDEKRRRERERKTAKRHAAPEVARAAARERYARNKEAINLKRRTEERRAHERERDRKRRQAHADAFRARDRARYALNRELKLAANTVWRGRNRERVRANARRRDALKALTMVGPVDYKAIMVLSGGACGICGEAVNISDPKTYHFDHIVPLARGGGHVQENIQLAHASCNLKKWAKSA